VPYFKNKASPVVLQASRAGTPLRSKTIMTENTSNAIVSKYPFAHPRDQYSPEIFRVLAIGSPKAVDSFVMTLFSFGYARPDEWSMPLPTVNSGEVMRILTKRVNLAN
jgi:hypothetical protein